MRDRRFVASLSILFSTDNTEQEPSSHLQSAPKKWHWNLKLESNAATERKEHYNDRIEEDPDLLGVT
eukprot:11102924-Ditylum_brightwellii.AAC.1